MVTLIDHCDDLQAELVELCDGGRPTPGNRKISRMNARQRKKHHVAEFRETLFLVDVIFESECSIDSQDDLLDSLLELLDDQQAIAVLSVKEAGKRVGGLVQCRGDVSKALILKTNFHNYIEKNYIAQEVRFSGCTDAFWGVTQ